jgi:hypothetical protein
MPSLFHIAGPAIISVRPNGVASPPLELGFCERSPEIQFEPEYEGTLNTAGGTQYGSIYTYQGTEANIDVLLTRFDLATVAQIANRFGFSVNGGLPVMAVGVPNEPGAPGVPYSMPNGVANVSLLIGYPFVNQVVEFPICLIRAVRVFDIGTVPRKMFFRFRAIRNFLGVTAAGTSL